MKKFLFLILFCGALASCGTSKKTLSPPRSHPPGTSQKTEPKVMDKPSKKEITHKTKVRDKKDNPDKAAKIVDYAKNYLGTRYRYGGQTERGMDCSGLIYTAFLNAGDIFLPRTSRAMAKEGRRIPKNKIKKGDLVFFKTNRSRVINHIGLVIKNKKGKVRFIHASTSKGVMISSLTQSYWKAVFVEARRVL